MPDLSPDINKSNTTSAISGAAITYPLVNLPHS